jgi:hypothetical protein
MADANFSGYRWSIAIAAEGEEAALQSLQSLRTINPVVPVSFA